ncbi:2-amino-4-hydroxy-6-hydroxymethyldihydropteridine diphosphokinase [bacterium SCSIO 12741]|nr:2-amino-4-hydroxy-6-hydroxymethyldihydropteridine diphosphokinase [bacterium SCSIO 12741]
MQSEEMMEVLISLGSNLGSWEAVQQLALDEIEARIGRLERLSQVYRTEPWGVKDQPYFKNQVVLVHTRLSAPEVLNQLLNIEKECGRDREKEDRWGPRSLDLDILFYGNEQVADSNLEIPHPRLHQRKFILIPLSEVAPDLIHPITAQSVREMLDYCTDDSKVELYEL